MLFLSTLPLENYLEKTSVEPSRNLLTLPPDDEKSFSFRNFLFERL